MGKGSFQGTVYKKKNRQTFCHRSFSVLLQKFVDGLLLKWSTARNVSAIFLYYLIADFSCSTLVWNHCPNCLHFQACFQKLVITEGPVFYRRSYRRSSFWFQSNISPISGPEEHEFLLQPLCLSRVSEVGWVNHPFVKPCWHKHLVSEENHPEPPSKMELEVVIRDQDRTTGFEAYLLGT